MRAKTAGFTGIIPTREAPWRAMFLRGERVAQISETGLVWEGPLTDIHQGCLTLPEPYASCSEAALDLHVPHTSTRHVFIAGDRCLDWDWREGQQYEGPVTGLPGFGSYLPAEYRSDVDAAMQVPGTPWKTLLIKGKRCALIVWGQRVEYEGPLTARGEAGWKQLPAQMSGDFDDALMLYAGGNNRTVFIKGDQAMDFHWINGPTKIGSWAHVLPGLGALPAAYRTPRLPAAGRFSGVTGDVRVDLRVDLVGALPVVSGDLFKVSAGGYLNSFVLEGSRPATLPATITGTAKFASNTSTPMVSVKVDLLAPGGTATLTHSAADGTNATTYTCAYVSRFLRTIDWEVDAMADTKPAPHYFTTTHPRPPGLAKKLVTVQSTYAEAGIEPRTAGTVVNQVAVDQAGADLRWSDAELHAAMVSNFSGHRDTEQWKLWSFIATRHVDDDDGTQGVMFDRDESPRQGMAVFHTEMAMSQLAGTRGELHTWVHELGHAFNLMHSWDKNLADPPQPLGPRGGYGDLSWMNYEHNYQGPNGEKGEAAFWAAFTHQFTANELRHLRHGFYRNVVMGGLGLERGAGAGAAYRHTLERFDPPPAGRSGLRLELYGRDTFSHGEPVVTEIKGTPPLSAIAVDEGHHGDGASAWLTPDDSGHTSVISLARYARVP
ncbi:hypothetical protein [Streptosporangium roseum]|uniref:hypothetical protein n=1 Tax=Streptosporangium roseum TaxID=2001 RepID=UPI00331E3ADE